MTPGARVSAAIEVLDRWLGGVPVEKALTSWARGARYAGSKDRAAVRDHVYDVLRRKGSCELMGGSDGRGLLIGLLRLQGQDPSDWFTGEGHAPLPLQPAEDAYPGDTPDPWADIPVWLKDPLRQSLGSSADDVIRAMQDRAPLFVRVNVRKTTVSEAQECLSSDGIYSEITPLETALSIREGGRRLRQAKAYLDGLVEIQDLSVQMACAAVAWPRSGRILDLCAGGGGKALAIAAVSEAQVFVHDANPARMADIPDRARRAGVHLRAVARPEDHAPYDLVLCDVPCSGSGTWRRDPEAKWRLTENRLAALGRVQSDIIGQSQRLVSPGGRVVYMTCSLLRTENEEIIENALCEGNWALLQSRRFQPPQASDGFFLAEIERRQ